MSLLVFFCMYISFYMFLPQKLIDTYSGCATALPETIKHSTLFVWAFSHPYLLFGKSIGPKCDVHAKRKEYSENLWLFLLFMPTYMV